MESGGKFLLLLALGGGGYYTHLHWDEISTACGLDELRPGKTKAIKLGREAQTIERGTPNWRVIDERIRSGRIEAVGDLWTADHKNSDLYIVHCCFRQNGDLFTQDFEVRLGSRAVTQLDLEAGAPR